MNIMARLLSSITLIAFTLISHVQSADNAQQLTLAGVKNFVHCTSLLDSPTFFKKLIQSNIPFHTNMLSTKDFKTVLTAIAIATSATPTGKMSPEDWETFVANQEIGFGQNYSGKITFLKSLTNFMDQVKQSDLSERAIALAKMDSGLNRYFSNFEKSLPPHLFPHIKKMLEYKNKDAVDLADYLKYPKMPDQVLTLAKQGVAKYQDPESTIAVSRAHNGNSPGAGRTASWIEDTFGKSEATIRQEFSSPENKPLQAWTVKDIDTVYAEMTEINPGQEDATHANLTMVKGVGIGNLHEAPLGKGAMVQFASQFNYLESPGDYLTDVRGYIQDYTQGPLGVIEGAASTLYRDAHVRSGKLPHAFHKIMNPTEVYKNGYLKLYQIPEERQSIINHFFSYSIQKLRVLPQWTICEATGTTQIHICSAAPSFQGAHHPDGDSLFGKMCETIVAAQYEAIAKMAVIRHLTTQSELPVHFTLVGQGVFGNPASVMKESFERVAKIVKPYPGVRVFIHAYGYGDQQKVINTVGAQNELINLAQLTKEQFMVAQ